MFKVEKKRAPHGFRWQARLHAWILRRFRWKTEIWFQVVIHDGSPVLTIGMNPSDEVVHDYRMAAIKSGGKRHIAWTVLAKRIVQQGM